MSTKFALWPIILCAATAGCNARDAASPASEVAIEVVDGRPVAGGIYVNGSGPYRFLIDTGAQTNQLYAPLAGAIGLSPTYRVELESVSGTVLVPGLRGAMISLGPATAADQEILLTGLDAVQALSPGIHGVLGQEFLSRFDYLLDFAGGRLSFAALEPENGLHLGLQLVHGRPAIPTDLGTLILDSGAATAVLYRNRHAPAAAALRTAAGSVAASAPRSTTLRIAGRRLLVNAVSVALPGRAESGLLPAAAFRRVYVSNSRKLVVLDPPLT